MINEEILGIMNDADEVMESINYDPFGMIDVMEGSMSINKITLEEMKDPVAVRSLKNQLKSAKRWQTVLKVLVALNGILAGVGVVGAKVGTDKIINNPDNYYSNTRAFTWGGYNTKKTILVTNKQLNAVSRDAIVLLKLVPVISLAVSVLCALVKKALANKELKDIVTLDAKINSSISLYEKQMKDAGPKEKESLQKSIDALRELQELSKSERDRIDKKSDK